MTNPRRTVTATTAADDEALARALQEEYNSEFARANNRPRASAPTRTPTVRPSAPPVRPSAPPGSRTSTVLSDAELARRLAAEEQAEQRRRQQRQQRQQPPPPAAWDACRSDQSGRTSPRSSSSSHPSDDDVALARRLEQELRDEEIARRLTQQEQAAMSQQRARQMATRSTTTSPGCTVRRCCSYLISILVIVAAAAGCVYYFVYKGNKMPNWVPNPQDFANEDPFNQLSPQDANRWKTNDGMHGLPLLILNALDDKWHEYFDLAVSEWDNGDPDALTLTTAMRKPDSLCEPVQGKLKVCNGNYGDTKWRGINQVLLTDGYIISSAAKMNEYYLIGASGQGMKDQMQYTMCHEMGHGFGLPHADENFYNKDMGNCMDYTVHPGVNKQPDRDNYVYLAQLYGTMAGGPWNVTKISGATNPPSGATSSSLATTSGNGGLRRTRNLSQETPSVEQEGDDVPAWVWEEWKRLVPAIEQNTHDPTEWKVLHQTIGGEAHERSLGNGYTIQVHKLLVQPDSEASAVIDHEDPAT